MRSAKPIEKFKRVTARRLRASATEAEKQLWRHLKRMEADGTHFRRQVPVGRYVADFACMAAHLVIELDGSQHGAEANKARDDTRALWLESEGYRVLRFWNNDVTENIDGVLEAIYAALYGSTNVDPTRFKHARRKRNHPTPARVARRPSPSRGG